MVVTGRAHRAAVEAQLPALADDNIVLESEPRDSTAAIGLAAAILERREPGVIIGSFAADHVISGDALFRSAVAEAVAAADAGYIATIGITPTEPAVGFGYIECGDDARASPAPSASRPCRASSRSPTSRRPSGTSPAATHLWNAGMFIARADRCSRSWRATKPELHAGLIELADAWDDPATRGPAVDRIWPTLEKIAIDYSVAEPAAAAGRLAVIRGHFALGRRGRLRLAREAQHRRAARASSRSSARTPGCSPTRRAASS